MWTKLWHILIPYRFRIKWWNIRDRCTALGDFSCSVVLFLTPSQDSGQVSPRAHLDIGMLGNKDFEDLWLRFNVLSSTTFISVQLFEILSASLWSYFRMIISYAYITHGHTYTYIHKYIHRYVGIHTHAYPGKKNFMNNQSPKDIE